MKTTNDCEITLILDNTSYKITLDKTALISNIANELFKSFSLNEKNYEIIYKNQNLNLLNNSPLYKLIENDKNPIFYLNKKNNLSEVGKDIMSRRNLSELSDKKKQFIIIHNANKDTKNIINGFNSINKEKKCEIVSDSSGLIGEITVNFNDSQSLNEFLNYFNYITSINPDLQKLNIQIGNINNNNNNTIDNLKVSHRIKRNNTNEIKAIKHSKLSKSYNFQSYNNSKFNKPKKKHSQKLINNLHKKNALSDIDKSDLEIINDFYSHQYYIRNSSPYISETEQRALEEKENKKHFLENKHFFVSVGKYSMKPNYISNYVQMTPSENPLNHKFRSENKEKWMTKKGFINA